MLNKSLIKLISKELVDTYGEGIAKCSTELEEVILSGMECIMEVILSYSKHYKRDCYMSVCDKSEKLLFIMSKYNKDGTVSCSYLSKKEEKSEKLKGVKHFDFEDFFITMIFKSYCSFRHSVDIKHCDEFDFMSLIFIQCLKTALKYSSNHRNKMVNFGIVDMADGSIIL